MADGVAQRDEAVGGATSFAAECRSAVLDWLRERWREGFPEYAEGLPPQVRPVGPVREHGYSIIQEFALAFGEERPPVHVVAKTRRAAHWGAARDAGAGLAARLAATEYRELERAYRFFRESGGACQVIRPVAYLPALHTLVVGRADGEDLGRLVDRGASDLETRFRWAGTWLRQFHDGVHAQESRPWDFARFDSGIRGRMRALVGLGVDRAGLERLLARFTAAARPFADVPVPVSTLHGDMKLRHVWATSRGIQVLDFGNAQEGECYVDVAAFLVEMMVLSLGRPFRGSGGAEALDEAFLQGYFGTRVWPPILRLYLVAALVKKWGRRLRRWSYRGPWPLVQSGLERVGAKRIVDRIWLDPWFRRAVDTQLARLGDTR